MAGTSALRCRSAECGPVLGFLGFTPSAALAGACNRAVRAAIPVMPARLSPSPAAPYVNLNPVREEEIDGHRIFRPAGKRQPIGHLLHFHGLGAFSKQEVDFLHRLAAGKFQGEPITVVAPMAQSLIARDLSFQSLQSFYALACFIRQQPHIVQDLLLENLASNAGFLAQMWKLMLAVGNPPSWYPFVFQPALGRHEAAAESVALAGARPAVSSWRSLGLAKGELEPDFDATIKLMLKTAEEIAPRTDAVLDRAAAIPGRICASGFSQGVGPAIIFSAVLRPGMFCRLIAICASHIKTPHTPAVRDTEIKIDVILPRGDPILKATGFRDVKTRRNLEADFPGRWRIWEPPGSHAVEGHVAHIAGTQIVNSLRNSYRKCAA